MQLRFGRDVATTPEWSKFDYLALSCARRIRGVAYGPAVRDALSVVQCGNGRIIGPDGYRNGRYIAICHDENPKYDDIVSGAKAVIGIGCSIRNAVSVDTYPLDECDRHRLPKRAPCDVVCGGLGELPSDLSIDCGRVISFNQAPGDRPWNRTRELLSLYYRSAPVVVHCGNGNGTGYLGALAAYHCDTAVFVHGSKPDKVTTFEEFARALRGITG